MKRSFIREILDVITTETISFAGGLPDPALFPKEALKVCAQEVLDESGALQYASSLGERALREKIAARYCEQGFATQADEILVTTGSQQAINLIALAFLKRGVTVELPAYLGALGVFALHGVATDGLPLEPEGVAPDALARSLERTGAAYLIPDFQNPTGMRYGRQRRDEIATVLAAGDALLIEDAAYSELYFDTRYPAISMQLPQRSFHLGSFSKILAPGLRVGWVRSSHQNIARLLAVKESLDLHTATLNQRLIVTYWERYGLDAHIGKIRNSYRIKMEMMADALETQLPQFRFQRPQGGMFLYGTLPGVDTRALVRRALEHGVAFVPGGEFYPDAGPNDAIRFNFTHTDPEQMSEGIARIAALL